MAIHTNLLQIQYMLEDIENRLPYFWEEEIEVHFSDTRVAHIIANVLCSKMTILSEIDIGIITRYMRNTEEFTKMLDLAIGSALCIVMCENLSDLVLSILNTYVTMMNILYISCKATFIDFKKDRKDRVYTISDKHMGVVGGGVCDIYSSSINFLNSITTLNVVKSW